MGLAVLAAAAGAPDAAAGLLYSSDYFATLTYLSPYSLRAPRRPRPIKAAATSLEKAGISGRGLVDLFDTFRYRGSDVGSPQVPLLPRTTRSTPNASTPCVCGSKIKYYNDVDSPEALAQHAIMVAKLKAFMNSPQQTFVEFKEKDTSFPARYARAIAYYRALDTDHAVKLEDALLTDYPDNPYLWELKGQTLFESAHSQGGGRRLSATPSRSKSNAPLLQILLGQAILAEEDKSKVDDAIGHLRLAVGIENDNSLAWRLLSEAYDMKGDAGQGAPWPSPSRNFYLGQMREARSFAMRAYDLLPKNIHRMAPYRHRPGLRPDAGGAPGHEPPAMTRPLLFLAAALALAVAGCSPKPTAVQHERRGVRPPGARLPAGAPRGDRGGQRQAQRGERRPARALAAASGVAITARQGGPGEPIRATSWPIRTTRSRWWSSSTTAAPTAKPPCPTLKSLIQNNRDVRFVFKEFPILPEFRRQDRRLPARGPGRHGLGGGRQVRRQVHHALMEQQAARRRRHRPRAPGQRHRSAKSDRHHRL